MVMWPRPGGRTRMRPIVVHEERTLRLTRVTLDRRLNGRHHRGLPVRPCGLTNGHPLCGS